MANLFFLGYLILKQTIQNLKSQGKFVKKIYAVKEMLELASQTETGNGRDYNSLANKCSKIPDSVSKKLFEQLVEDEEKYIPV